MNATRAAAARAAASRILRRHAVLAAWLAGAALATASGALYAASVSAPFHVELLLFPFKDVAQCDQTVSGANVQVSCTSPAPGPDQRFMLHVYRAGTEVGMVDGTTAPGTVTSWKVVRIADRDFLEIVVGW